MGESTVTARPSPGSGLLAISRYLLEFVAANKVVTLLLYFGWIFVKVLAASHGSLTTALGILDASSLPLIVAGATLSFLPVVVMDLFAIIVYLATAGYWRGRWMPPDRPTTWHGRLSVFCARNVGLILLTLVVVVGTVVLPSLTMMTATLAFAATFGLVARLMRHPTIDEATRSGDPTRPAAADVEDRTTADLRSHVEPVIQRLRDGHVLQGMVVLLVILFALTDVPQIIKTMWNPHEALYRPDNSTVLDVGYVLDDAGDSIVLLRTHTRDLHIWSKTVVGRRQVCVVGDAWLDIDIPSESLFQAVFHQSQVPICPPAP